MKTIRLKIVDASPRMPRTLLEFVADRYEFELVDENPDFVLHSCRSRNVLKHDGVRIAFIGENLVPDFNISDYAMGFSRIDFGDRYFRLPLYRIWNKINYEKLKQQRPRPADTLAGKTSFCSCVVSNANRDPFFERAFEAINQYKQIESGGRWNNNVGGPVIDKIAFCARSKFVLVCENSSSPGYITEKIVDAMISNSVPIYWGAPDVALDFNPKSFINCHDFDSLDGLVNHIAEIDRDDTRYQEMLSASFFVGEKEPSELSSGRIASFLSGIFDQLPDKARRTNRTFWGATYVAQERRAWFRPDLQTLWHIRNWLRNRKKKSAEDAILKDSIKQMRIAPRAPQGT